MNTMATYGNAGPNPEYLPAYQYTQLSDYEIRILCLEPGAYDSPLRGRIDVVDAKTASYVAISYVWGHPERSHRVEIKSPEGASEILLTESLNRLLRDLRSYRTKTDQNGVAIWVDQICINQENNAEKSVQVAMMSDIYRGAQAVITYIGPKDPSSQRGISMIKEIYTAAAPYTDDLQRLSMDIGRNPVPVSVLLDQYKDADWDAFRLIVDRSWLDRVWIVQESVLNKSQVIACGDILFDWSWLATAAHLFNMSGHFRGLAQRRHDDSIWRSNTPKLWVSSQLPSHSRVPHPVLMTVRMEKMFQFETARIKISAGESSLLLNLLAAFRRSSCGDDRDKVYALLGLAADVAALKILPDYDKSVTDLYHEVAVRIISVHGNLDVLHHSKNTSWSPRAMPSWVPDWSRMSNKGTGHSSDNLSWAPTGPKNDPPRMHFLEDDRVLAAEGIFFDEITLDCDMWIPSTAVFPYGTPQAMAKYFCLDVIEQACQGIGISLWHLEPPQADRLACFLAETPAGHHVTASDKLGGRPLYESLMAELKMFREEQAPLNFFPRTLIEECRTSLSKHLCVTKNGRLCNSHRPTKPGDRIAVLFGGKMCYILRPAEEAGRYTLVSNSFVEFVMNGELLDNPGWKDNVETIQIV